MPERLILQAPAARRALLRGVDTMAALLRPTLGPVARTVAVMGFSRTSPPEILDSARKHVCVETGCGVTHTLRLREE